GLMMSSPRSLMKTLHAALVEAQEYRQCMPMNFNVNDVDPYWNTYEMLTMLKEVNVYRRSRGWQLASYGDIKRVETMAAGHVDYTTKFALYCAELRSE